MSIHENPHPCNKGAALPFWFSHGLRNEWYPISGVAFDRLSSLSCFQKAEVFLILCQHQARALNGPMKPLQPKGQLVAHPVGLLEASQLEQVETEEEPEMQPKE